jgi:uncharacterized protein (TIGR03118 family)
MHTLQRTITARSGRVRFTWLAALAALITLALLVPVAWAGARTHHNASVYVQTNLISDINGVARITDPNLVNPWGVAFGPTTPIWVADNGKDVSTLYSGGVRGSIPQINPLVVSIPGGAPTGLVFNPTTDFVVTQGAVTAPARFIFSSEAGQITAWTLTNPPQTNAVTKASDPTAIYKGLALVSGRYRPSYLLATDFHNGVVRVFDKGFKPVALSGSFTDPNLPAGFAPFGIQVVGGRVLVTFAKQDANKEDDVAAPGNGIVDVFDTNGHFVRRLVSGGDLNSPWGLAVAPRGFGAFSGDLLVGNFGDGAIHAYSLKTGAEVGQLKNADGNPILIDGLWSLKFGNGVTGTSRTLLFTAGIGGESHGLFGEITVQGHSGVRR